MTAEREPFNPAEHFRNLKGQHYLETKWRIVWLREEHAEAYIVTEMVEHDAAGGMAVFKARAGWFTPDGREVYSTGYGSETRKDFTDYLEKAETKSVGRALAMLGYGTAQAIELDEAEGGVVDTPVSPHGRPAPPHRQRPPQLAVMPQQATPSPAQAQRKRLTELLARFPDAAAAIGDNTLPDHLLAGAIAKLEARFGADVEADTQEQLADALELARTAIDHVSKKRGGPTVDDASAMRDILSELQRLQLREGDRPAREIASKDLVAVIAKRLPATAKTPEAVGVGGTLLPDAEPF